ncbi:efflux RND transporter periplasmic adaptor subunit [Oceanobacillus saliphilus]|uniref:efflux RND transporter periplasmic adaptor subunit n=1 Tax=Oceanobacillus saliphilus TaxID=2925834 RepID=UPI00201D7600|nr:efflux RND transporter periplasmic adaptor subunit [Oceanobacillus saliphilus]
MKKMRFGLAAMLMMGILAACTEEDAAEEVEERIVPVETAEAETGDLVVEKTIYGRTAPNSTTPIMLQAPGEVDALEVENGTFVEEDDLIAKISTAAGIQNIRASKDGEIIQLQAAEGEMATSEEPFAIIADMNEMKLQFSVTASVRALITVDDTFTTVIENQEYEVTITEVNVMPDETGLYPIEATVENEESEILPGLIAVLNIPEKKIEDSILVPTSAVVYEDDLPFVYIINDDRAEKVEISITETQTDKSAIEGDVQPGDQIVITGQLTLSDGDQVDAAKGE